MRLLVTLGLALASTASGADVCPYEADVVNRYLAAGAKIVHDGDEIAKLAPHAQRPMTFEDQKRIYKWLVSEFYWEVQWSKYSNEARQAGLVCLFCEDLSFGGPKALNSLDIYSHFKLISDKIYSYHNEIWESFQELTYKKLASDYDSDTSDLPLALAEAIREAKQEIYAPLLSDPIQLKNWSALPECAQRLANSMTGGPEPSADPTQWKFAPFKLAGYPLTKLFYDVPALLTNFLTESVTRSPEQNLSSAGMDATMSAKSLKKGASYLQEGVLHPQKAAIVDGTLQVLETGMGLAKTAADLGKSLVSVFAHPAYQLVGGNKHETAKKFDDPQAAIIIVDSHISGLVNASGELMIENQIRPLVDHYCIADYLYGDKIKECVRRLPKDLKTLHVIALTHSGGSYRADSITEEVSKALPELKPGIVLSVGCFDNPSKLADAADTFGATGTSFSVGLFLSNAIAKRLRGIPMDEASTEAYWEALAFPVNPVIPATVAVSAIDFDDAKKILAGSKPVVKSRGAVSDGSVQASNSVAE